MSLFPEQTNKKTQKPHRKQEQWKNTPLGFLDKYSEVSAGPGQTEIHQKPGFVEIHLKSDQQKNPDVNVPGLSVRWEKTASVESGVYFEEWVGAQSQQRLLISIEKGWSEYTTLSLYMDQEEAPSSAVAPFQLKIEVASQCHLKMSEKVTLKERDFVLSNTNYELKPGSSLTLLKIEEGAGRSLQNSRFNIEKDALLKMTVVNGNCEWSRANAEVNLQGEGAQAHMTAAYMVTGEQYVDHHSVIRHLVPHTESSQNYHGILNEKSRAVFNGQVHIARDAQKSNAQQLNKNLVLSESAVVNTKPELRVDADDVKAAHGATVGQMQEEELFYLKSRGIDESTARLMLSEGFVMNMGEALPESLHEIFRESVRQSLKETLKGDHAL